MDEFEKWRQHKRDTSIKLQDEDAREAYFKAYPIKDDSGDPFRLEVLYKPVGELVIIQGNVRGLRHLYEAIGRLIEISPVDSHIHFDLGSPLTESEIPLIIQKVADVGDGSHGIR